VIDVRDEDMGAWFEARIIKISPINNNNSEHASVDSSSELEPESSSGVESGSCASGSSTSLVTNEEDDGFLYNIVFER